MMEAKKLRPEVRAALLEVWQKSQRDGNEHMVVLDPKTLEVAGRSSGDARSVETPKECQRPDTQWIVIHSHPGPPNSLSLQDLCCAANFGGIVAAITDDQMVYAAKPHAGPNTIWTQGLIHGCVTGGANQHADNLKLEKLGLIDYEYGKLEEA